MRPVAAAKHDDETHPRPPGRGGFRHSVFFYDDADSFLQGTVSFVRAGLEAGEPAMVLLRADRLAALRAELGEPEGLITADMAVVGSNPARLLPAWRHFVDGHGAGARPVRGVGEPIWASRSPAEMVECQLHEALLNLAFAGDTGFELMCPYDTAGLDASVLDEARHSHGLVGAGETATPCPDFTDGSGSRYFELPLPPPVGEVDERCFGPSDLAGLRRLVGGAAAAAGFGDRSAEIALAVHEAAANSVRHGGGRGLFRTWSEGSSLVFEISNQGRVVDPLVGRVAPSSDNPSGRGVWLMNQMCDLVQIRNTPEGVVIRLHAAADA